MRRHRPPKVVLQMLDLVRIMSHSLVASVDNVVREINEKLSKTSFGSRIIAKDRLKGSISERFWQALAECLTSSCVVAQSGHIISLNSL